MADWFVLSLQHLAHQVQSINIKPSNKSKFQTEDHIEEYIILICFAAGYISGKGPIDWLFSNVNVHTNLLGSFKNTDSDSSSWSGLGPKTLLFYQLPGYTEVTGPKLMHY
jgi:hypothetical protein